MNSLAKSMGRRTFFVGVFFILTNCNIIANEIATGVPDRGIQISPSKITLDSHPGDVKEFVINVKNYDKKITHKVTVEIEDFYVTNESAKAQFFIPNNEHKLKAYDVIDWIEIEKNFILRPEQSRNVKVKVTIPEYTATGGYYGAIFFQTSEAKMVDKKDEETKSSINVNYRVGMLLINAVYGSNPVNIDGKINSFGATKKIFWDSPMEIFANLYSTGNVHYKAGGRMEIKKFGKKFAVVDVGSAVMYPNRSRIFKEIIQTDLWDFGVYKASLDMQSEDGSVTFKKNSQIFYVIPWKTICMIIGSILFLVISTKVFRRKFTIINNKKIRN